MTFLDLQNSVAIISGFPNAASFAAGDLTLAKQVINEVYLECYLPDESKAWPRWARKQFGVQFRAASNPTITLTQGCTVFTGWSPPSPDNMIGSRFKIGDGFYTYAGVDSDENTCLLEPWDKASGPYGTTLYHGSYVLPVSVLEFCEAPELQGWGPLTPIAGRETDILYRSNFLDGFRPMPGEGWNRESNRLFGGTTFDTGQPIFYMVSEGMFLDAGASAVRLELRPLPDQICNVTFEAQYAPALLSSNSDIPTLAGDLVSQLMLPMIRGRWAATYKKYTGENIEALMSLATRAERRLDSMRIRQKRLGIRTACSHC